MNIENNRNGEKYMLKVPSNFAPILNKLMISGEEADYQNGKIMLKYFCGEFCQLDHINRSEFEFILNSRVAKTKSLADMVTLLHQMGRYYRLRGIDSKRKLGEFRILAARRSDQDNPLAKASLTDTADIGDKIMQAEKGVFYKNDYVGMFVRFLVTDD